MQDLLDSSKLNPTALRYFIQYELLQKKPIWESYKSFCQFVGNQAMGYPEFEFWFWKFYNGDVDVEYDRSEDSKPMELMQLPLEIVEKVAERLAPTSIVAARNVCKALRSVVDNREMRIEEIRLDISAKPFALVNKMEIAFREKKTSSQEQLNLVISYLRQLLQNSKSIVAFFNLSFGFPNAFSHTLQGNLSGLRFNVKSVSIMVWKPVSVDTLFPLFQPRVLEHIAVKSNAKSNFSIQETLETEQFRQAKSIDMSKVDITRYYIGVDVLKDNFSHFSCFHISVQTISVKYLLQLKDHFQQLASFDFLLLTILSKSFKIIPIFDLLAKALDVVRQERGIVNSPIPGFDGYMEFTFEGDRIGMQKKRYDCQNDNIATNARSESDAIWPRL